MPFRLFPTAWGTYLGGQESFWGLAIITKLPNLWYNHCSVSLRGRKNSSAILLISSTILLERLIVLDFAHEIKIEDVRRMYFEVDGIRFKQFPSF